MAKIISLDSVQDEIFSLQRMKQQRGYLIGFSGLDRIYSVKGGTSTIIYGYPTSGKSQFLIQTLTALASTHGKKAMILSPETGTTAEIYAEIIHCLTGKTFRDTQNYTITEKELYNVIPFVKDYFKVVDIDEDSISPEEFCELTKEGVKDYGIFSSSFDNWNDLKHNIGQREDLYIEQAIPMFNRLARKNNIHIFGVWHAKNPSLQNSKFPAQPTPFEIKGGSAIYSKSMNLLCAHREYEEHGEGVRQTNTLIVTAYKIKPKIVGEKGFCKLEFDVFRNAYFENQGERVYLKTQFNGITDPERTSEPKQFNPAPF